MEINYTKYLHSKSSIYAYAICSLLFKLTVIFIPATTQLLIDSATQGDAVLLLKYALLSLIVVIIFLVLMYIVSKTQITMITEIQRGIKSDIANHVINGEYETISKYDLGYFLQRHNGDVEGCEFLYYEAKINFIVNIIFMIALGIAMFITSYKVSLVLLLAIPIFIIANKKMIPIIERKIKKFYEQEEKVNEIFEESYNGRHAIRAMKHEETMMNKYQAVNDKAFRLQFDYYTVDEKYNTVIVNGILNLCNTVVYIFGGYLVLNGEITVGALLALAVYFGRIWSPIEFFLGYKKKLAKAKVSEKRILEVLNEKIKTNKDINEIVEFKKVKIDCISFDIGDTSILKNTYIELEKDNSYYIDGANGSGKTTLFNLISGIYNRNVVLYVDGVKLEHANDFLRNNTYFLPSEDFCLKGTILDNLEQNITNCPIPNHDLNDDVNTLSAGERRLLQLQAVKYRKELIIILDEPLNYLGSEFYNLTLDIIADLKKHKILLISSHDKTVQKYCNNRILLENGILIKTPK